MDSQHHNDPPDPRVSVDDPPAPPAMDHAPADDAYDGAGSHEADTPAIPSLRLTHDDFEEADFAGEIVASRNDEDGPAEVEVVDESGDAEGNMKDAVNLAADEAVQVPADVPIVEEPVDDAVELLDSDADPDEPLQLTLDFGAPPEAPEGAIPETSDADLPGAVVPDPNVLVAEVHLPVLSKAKEEQAPPPPETQAPEPPQAVALETAEAQDTPDTPEILDAPDADLPGVPGVDAEVEEPVELADPLASQAVLHLVDDAADAVDVGLTDDDEPLAFDDAEPAQPAPAVAAALRSQPIPLGVAVSTSATHPAAGEDAAPEAFAVSDHDLPRAVPGALPGAADWSVRLRFSRRLTLLAAGSRAVAALSLGVGGAAGVGQMLRGSMTQGAMFLLGGLGLALVAYTAAETADAVRAIIRK